MPLPTAEATWVKINKVHHVTKDQSGVCTACSLFIPSASVFKTYECIRPITRNRHTMCPVCKEFALKAKFVAPPFLKPKAEIVAPPKTIEPPQQPKTKEQTQRERMQAECKRIFMERENPPKEQGKEQSQAYIVTLGTFAYYAPLGKQCGVTPSRTSSVQPSSTPINKYVADPDTNNSQNKPQQTKCEHRTPEMMQREDRALAELRKKLKDPFHASESGTKENRTHKRW